MTRRTDLHTIAILAAGMLVGAAFPAGATPLASPLIAAKVNAPSSAVPSSGSVAARVERIQYAQWPPSQINEREFRNDHPELAGAPWRNDTFVFSDGGDPNQFPPYRINRREFRNDHPGLSGAPWR